MSDAIDRVRRYVDIMSPEFSDEDARIHAGHVGGKAATLYFSDLRALLARLDKLERGLTRIAEKHGICSYCGTACKNFTECDCPNPTWAPLHSPLEARIALLEHDQP